MLFRSLATTTGDTDGAKTIADGINTNTFKHGVVATAFNRVVGAEMGPEFSMTGTFTISTEGVSETIAIQSSMSDLVDQINLQVQGITASQGANNSLILEKKFVTKFSLGSGVEGASCIGSNISCMVLPSSSGG